jgi:protein SCO1/2
MISISRTITTIAISTPVSIPFHHRASNMFSRTRTIQHSLQRCTRHLTTKGHSQVQSQSQSQVHSAKVHPKYTKTTAGTGLDPSGGAAASMMPRGPVSWASLGLVAVAAATAVGYYQIERERRLENAMGKIVSTGKPAIGGEWSLIDLSGNLVTNKSFEGKWILLYFGFARCPDICPSEMVKVGQVMDTLKKDYPDLASKVKPVFVSVDPARDSLKALKEYAKDFHPEYIFLTGSPDQVQQMAKKYRVYVSKADETEDGDYLVDHSIVIYFHDDTGDMADCFTQSMRPTDVVEKILERMTFQSSV